MASNRPVDPARALLVTSDRDLVAAVAGALGAGALVEAVAGEEAAARAAEGGQDVVLLDLAAASGLDPAALAGHDGERALVALTREGGPDAPASATAVLPASPLDPSRLGPAVATAASLVRSRREGRCLRDRAAAWERLGETLGQVGGGSDDEAHSDRVLETLVVAGKTLAAAQASRVLLFERTQNEGLVVEAAAGDGADTLVGARLRVGEGLAALAAQTGQAVVVDDPERHPRFARRCDQMPASLPGLLCAPLRHGPVFGALMVAGRERGFSETERAVLQALGRHGALALDNAQARERAVNFFTHTSEILVSFMEHLDAYYSGHARTVAALSDMLTRRLGLDADTRRSVHFAALLHDIGKLRLAPGLLRARGLLDAAGREALRQHPVLGLELLEPITVWHDLLPIVHGHHEAWDGSGYPRGLAGEEIPLGARVVAVADAFDVMTRHSAGDARKTPEAALAALEQAAGTRFDPLLVRLFVAEYRRRREEIEP